METCRRTNELEGLRALLMVASGGDRDALKLHYREKVQEVQLRMRRGLIVV